MSAKYIIRLDDACPTMDQKKWKRVEVLLDRYTIKPIVAVIPNNKDSEQIKDKEDAGFWDKVRQWQDNGWHIALHGYDHLYISSHSGFLPFNNVSEFAGLDYERQEEKIKKGTDIFRSKGVSANIWVAPSHTFDENTLKAIKNTTDIDIVSDGIAIFPYFSKGFRWIPQQFWHFRKMPFGVWTSCFHPNDMTDQEFDRLEEFIEINHQEFVDVNDLRYKKLCLMNYLFEKLYWILRAGLKK